MALRVAQQVINLDKSFFHASDYGIHEPLKASRCSQKLNRSSDPLKLSFARDHESNAGSAFLNENLLPEPGSPVRAKKIILPALPWLPMHSPTSIMENISMWLLAFKTLKSCTRLRDPFFFFTANRGLLYRMRVGSMTPNFSHLLACFSTSSPWVSGIWNF